MKPSNATMITRPIPSTGEALPVIGLGTWQAFDVGGGATTRRTLAEVLRLFFAGGAKIIDSSPMYGRAEGVVGDLLRRTGRSRIRFYRDQGMDLGPGGGNRADETLCRALANRGHRPHADS